MQRLSTADRRDLLELGAKHWVRPGTVLLRAGAAATTAILILRTFVRVSVPAVDGHEPLLSVRVPGDLIGEIAVLDSCPRTATATACGTGLVSVIPSGQLKEFLAARPAVSRQLAGLITEQPRWSGRGRGPSGTAPATLRLARVLSQLAARHGERARRGVEIGVLPSAAELAALIGVSVATIRRALLRLRDQGLIETGQRRFLVTDLSGLHAMATASG